jgi:hypothetical protein
VLLQAAAAVLGVLRGVAGGTEVLLQSSGVHGHPRLHKTRQISEVSLPTCGMHCLVHWWNAQIECMSIASWAYGARIPFSMSSQAHW